MLVLQLMPFFTPFITLLIIISLYTFPIFILQSFTTYCVSEVKQFSCNLTDVSSPYTVHQDKLWLEYQQIFFTTIIKTTRLLITPLRLGLIYLHIKSALKAVLSLQLNIHHQIFQMSEIFKRQLVLLAF